MQRCTAHHRTRISAPRLLCLFLFLLSLLLHWKRKVWDSYGSSAQLGDLEMVPSQVASRLDMVEFRVVSWSVFVAVFFCWQL